MSAVLNEWAEAGVILFIVALNAVISIVQERKAQNALEALKNMSAPVARVLRQGEESIVPAAELVPGDVIFLEDGAIIPALESFFSLTDLSRFQWGVVWAFSLLPLVMVEITKFFKRRFVKHRNL